MCGEYNKPKAEIREWIWLGWAAVSERQTITEGRKDMVV
jgi:hypothetical protein